MKTGRYGWAMAGRGRRSPLHPHDLLRDLPLPWPPGQEAWRDLRLHAIVDAAHELNNLREKWLNPPDAAEAELKKRTLTNLYNTRPAWLKAAHDTLDRAVWVAHGWDVLDPRETSDDELLQRLLGLNHERASAHVSGGKR
jgi:hypothetical protein